MKTLKLTKTKLATFLTLALSCNLAFASNISEHLSTVADDRSDNYFRIGVGASYYKNPLEGDTEGSFNIPIEWRYDINGFFTELSSDSLGAPGLAAGYTVWENRNWRFDAMLTLSNYIDVSEIDRFDGSNLKDRGNALAGGLRATYFHNNWVVQANLLPFNSHGATGSISAGRNWQLGDWNFTAAGSVNYSSSKYNDFYFGVDAEQSSELFSEYDAGSGFAFVAEVGAEYEISEDWYFATKLRHAEYSSALKDSPLFAEDRSTGLSISINYVF